MESIGEKLKGMRDSKGYTLEQVARDTHIAKRFLTALESEDFAMLPGEPYLLGFLRNYAEYLGLSAQEMVSLYKNLKLQEQPVPMVELLERPVRRVPILIGGALVVAAALGLVAFLVFGGHGSSTSTEQSAKSQQPVAAKAAGAAKSTTGQDYSFQGGMKEQSFKRGDAITVQSKGKEYQLLLTDIGSTVTISTPTGVVDLIPNVEKVVDLSGDGKADIKLLVRSISTADATPSAVIRLDTSIQGTIAADNTSGAVPGPDTGAAGTLPGSGAPDAAAATAPGANAAVAGNPGTAAVAPATAANGTLITTAQSMVPFTIDLAFSSAALFRYSIDNGQRQERYYQAGERFTATASARFELWLSNAGAVQLVVSGNPVSLGTAGEIATDFIQWGQSGGSYRLELVPIN